MAEPLRDLPILDDSTSTATEPPAGPRPVLSNRAFLVSRSSRTRKWASRWLNQAGFELIALDDAARALELIEAERPQVVILDQRRLDLDNCPLLSLRRDGSGPPVPPIVTICGSDREVTRALAAGTTEVLRKPVNWHLAGRRIRLLTDHAATIETLGKVEQRTLRVEEALEEAQRQLNLLGASDPLTRLPNRRRFEELLDRALVAPRNAGHPAVLYLDLDDFKTINEMVGRRGGDDVLRQVAARLRDCIETGAVLTRRESGTGTAALARLSGDEFTLLLTHVTGEAEVRKTAAAIQQALSKPFAVDKDEVNLSATIGATVCTSLGEGRETFLQHAEVAMCEGKGYGGGVVRFYRESLNRYTQREIDIRRHLRGALEREEFTVHYQPLVESKGGQVVAAEALLRWCNDELGFVGPNEFIPVAESSGFMLKLGEWVLKTACRQLKQWQDEGLPHIRMAVNIAATQLQRLGLAELVRETVEETGIDPTRLELELSERGILRASREMVRQLEEIKALGVRVSVDDFGTGQAAIEYLRQFPVDVLKIDRSYIQGVADSASDAGIASAMVSMARSLSLTVVAEGVEIAQQRDLLRKWGCDELQGFLYSPAVTADEFRQILTTGFQAP